jgi:outer membrane lipoprotein SlyB
LSTIKEYLTYTLKKDGVNSMNVRKSSSREKRTTQGKVKGSPGSADRDKKILNSVINTSIILMSSMMGGLSETLVNAGRVMVSGMAGAVGGKEAGEKVNEEFNQRLPEINEEMRKMISDLRKEVSVQLRQKIKEIGPLLSDPNYDIGPNTIEKYDFNLPKLTEELDDNTLAQYIQLLIKEEPGFTQMFKELVSWMNTLPDSAEKTVKEEKGGETSFPLPDDVRDFSKPLKGDQVNFQTSMSLKQIATFYRRAFTKKGLAENKRLTNINEQSIGLIFDSADDDKAVILQSIDLASNTSIDLRNVNLKTEKKTW